MIKNVEFEICDRNQFLFGIHFMDADAVDIETGDEQKYKCIMIGFGIFTISIFI
jgi:hypothetical protein